MEPSKHDYQRNKTWKPCWLTIEAWALGALLYVPVLIWLWNYLTGQTGG